METCLYYQRYRPREGCAECNARRWYHSDGKKFCENGHEEIGYAQYDVDAEDNFGKLGRVARKKKKAREIVYKHLSGKEGEILYLVCLQLILRKQVRWLITNKGLDPELESVCRALWELRICKFPGLRKFKPSRDRDKRSKSRDDGYSSQTETDTATADPFSSQAESSEGAWVTTDNDELELDEEGYPIHLQKKSRVKDWSGRDALPSVSETLAILYLGCLLRKEPVRIGDIFKWAKADQLPYIGAMGFLPTRLSERLPGWAHKVFLTRYVTFRGGELHREVMTLMLGYQKNFGMGFPKLPVARPLLQYIIELALPPHVHRATQEVCARAGLDFTFPTNRDQDPGELSRSFNENKPHSLIDLPDVLLVAAMVVAVKYMYPLDGIERVPRDRFDPLALKMNWKLWEEKFAPREHTSTSSRRLDFENMDIQEVMSMSNDEKAEYLAWYENTRLSETRKKSQETAIEQLLFPLEPSRRPEPVEEELPDQNLEQEEIITRMKEIQSAMTEVEPRDGDDDDILRIGSLYPMLKKKHIKGLMKRFYEVTAEVSGLQFWELATAVYKLERLLKNKDDEERKREREEA